MRYLTSVSASSATPGTTFLTIQTSCVSMVVTVRRFLSLMSLFPLIFGSSAAGVQIYGRGVVIYNPRHSRGRQVSDITHELAHFILDHQPARIILSADLDGMSMRSFNQKQEDEANCLAWSLLLPREGLMKAKRRRLTVEQIAEQYGVTKSLAVYRLNATGVEKQLKARLRN